MQAQDLFVLDPANRAFIEGRGQRANPTRFFGCMVLFMVPFVLVGLFTLVLAFQGWFRVIGFQVAGATTQAEVLERGIRTDSDGDEHPFLILRYRLDEPGSDPMIQRLEVNWAIYQQYQTGDTLAIDYIRQSPTNLRLAGDTSSSLWPALFITGFTIFWNLITWVFVIVIGGSILKQRRLDQAGAIMPGELTSYATSIDSDNDLWVEVGYRFYTREGKLIEATEKTMRNSLRGTPDPPIGAPVAVFYANEQTYELL